VRTEQFSTSQYENRSYKRSECSNGEILVAAEARKDKDSELGLGAAEEYRSSAG
jgi:hypothetical protein